MHIIVSFVSKGLNSMSGYWIAPYSSKYEGDYRPLFTHWYLSVFMEYAALYFTAASSDGDGPGLGYCTYDVQGLSY